MDVVLVGGGHAHLGVLKAFGMVPEPGVRITLVARDLQTSYSGMMPGVIAGLYPPEESRIDLARLAVAVRAGLVHGQAVGLNRARKQVLVAGQDPVRYDLVSFDVGAAPDLVSIRDADKAIAVKPINELWGKLEALRARCRDGAGRRRITVIGGGATGVELLLSLQARLRAELAAAGRDLSALSFVLATDGPVLAGHNPRVRAAFRRIMRQRQIVLEEDRRVVAIAQGSLICADGMRIAADEVLLATPGVAPHWFAQTGLALDGRGFVAVHDTLQVLNDLDAFAAGDCATLLGLSLEKSGVYAVRAGDWLAANLRRRALSEALEPWRPQRTRLALISTGERFAVASWGAFKAEGAWVWSVKDWIDRRWMQSYRRLGGSGADLPRRK